MHRLFPTSALLLLLTATSAMSAGDIDQLPVTATFVVSGGSWQAGTEGVPLGDQRMAVSGSGYYKLVSIRQPDRSARIYLQMISAGADGPQLVESVELDEFSAIKPYVTGIQPESMSGVSGTPGFFATVYLKTDPQSDRVEEWTVLIDELGDIRVERATN